MKKLSSSEIAQLDLVRGSSAAIRAELDQLKLTEGIVIKPEDWKLKTTPELLLNSVYRKAGSTKRFAVSKIKNNGGWVVRRKA